MGRNAQKTYLFFIVFVEMAGILSGLLSRAGMQGYEEIMGNFLRLPVIAFPVVWTVLYALLGIGAARIWMSSSSQYRMIALLFFLLQMAVHFFWSPIFFCLQAFGGALLWLFLLWIMITLMILSYRKVDRMAAWLQFPYLMWVTFCGYLNYIAWVLN